MTKETGDTITIKKRKPTPNHCYRTVMNIMSDLDRDPAYAVLQKLGDVYAVHGFITNPGSSTYEHAWIEVLNGEKEYAYDPYQSKTLFDKGQYYETYGADPVRRMTGLEYAKLVLKFKFDGPYFRTDTVTDENGKSKLVGIVDDDFLAHFGADGIYR